MKVRLTPLSFVPVCLCVQPQWLLEVAQHYYDVSSIEDPNAKKKMPKTVGAAPGTFDR